MQFSKAAVLVLSAVSSASAGMGGRRLGGAMHPDCEAACKDKGHKELIATYMANMEGIESGNLSSLCPHGEALKCMEAAPVCQDDERRLSNHSNASSAPVTNESSSSGSTGSGEASSSGSNETSPSGSSEASSSGSSEASSSGSSEASSAGSGEEGHDHHDHDEHKDHHEEEEPKTSEKVACSCACPEAMKAMENFEAAKCKKQGKDAMKCLMSNSACDGILKKQFFGGKPKARFQKELEIDCMFKDAGCKKRNDDLAKCMGDKMAQFKDGSECSKAVSDETLDSKADKCCGGYEKYVECKSKACMDAEEEWEDFEMKDTSATQKDKDRIAKGRKDKKTVGKACPNTGLAPPATPTATASNGWASFPHAIILVAVIGGLIASY